MLIFFKQTLLLKDTSYLLVLVFQSFYKIIFNLNYIEEMKNNQNKIILILLENWFILI